MSKLFAGLRISQKGSDILALSINQSRQIDEMNSPIIKRSGNGEIQSSRCRQKILFDSPNPILKDSNPNFVSPIKMLQRNPNGLCEKCAKWQNWAKFYEETFLSIERLMIEKQNMLNQAFQNLSIQLHCKEEQLESKEKDIIALRQAVREQQQKYKQAFKQKMRIIDQLENQLVKKNTVIKSYIDTQSTFTEKKASTTANVRKQLNDISNIQMDHDKENNNKSSNSNRNSNSNNKQNKNIAVGKRIKTFESNQNMVKQLNPQNQKQSKFYASNNADFKDLYAFEPKQINEWQDLVRRLRFENKNLKAYNLNLQQMINTRNKKKFYF